MERFFLSLSQIRVGPGKRRVFGILQFFFDGLKLFSSELVFLMGGDLLFFFVCPFFNFFFMIFVFFFLPLFFNLINFVLIFLFFFLLLGLIIFFFLISSYFRKSKFRFLGLVRITSSSISFDICFIIFFLLIIFFLGSFNPISFLFFFFVLIFIFFFLVLIEVNRAPFDFSEGESELVSGFNTEFSSLVFVLVFLSEYGLILFYRVFITYIFFDEFFIFGFFLFFFFIEIRRVFPRFRYDKLIRFCWLIFLPIFIVFFVFFFVF